MQRHFRGLCPYCPVKVSDFALCRLAPNGSRRFFQVFTARIAGGMIYDRMSTRPPYRRPFSAAVRPSRRNIDVLLAFQYGCGAPWTGAHSLHKKFADRHRLTRRLFGVRKEEDFRGRAESLVKRQSARWTSAGEFPCGNFPPRPIKNKFAPDLSCCLRVSSGLSCAAVIHSESRRLSAGLTRPPLMRFHFALPRLAGALTSGARRGNDPAGGKRCFGKANSC